ncbi:lactate permease [Fusibacter tunisiensis]|uniref:L-lactate permease n=2 Tax=Fusibacter tunisiensis TaxID=1008308 RepID=A0ABS2MUC6_9FIRM|nr:lactate permease [Fusibacter tunisiensis]
MAYLTVIPVAVVLVVLLILKKSIQTAGISGFTVALIFAISIFKMTKEGIMGAMGKAFALSFYVLMIIWSALLLYHVLDEFGAIKKITVLFGRLIREPFAQFITLSWLLSGVLQSISGYGVPIVIVAPMLTALGYNAFKSSVAVLFGHTWAVSFGSMGAAYYTLFLATGLDQQKLGLMMIVFNCVLAFGTGLTVAWFHSGKKGMKRSLKYILPSTLGIGVAMYGAIKLGSYTTAALAASLTGLLITYGVYRFFDHQDHQEYENYLDRVPNFEADMPTAGVALAPYVFILLAILSVNTLQLPDWQFALSFPETTTGLGYVASKADHYAAIQWLGHPGPILGLATLIFLGMLYRRKTINSKRLKRALNRVVRQGIGVSIGLMAFIAMSIVMMDSGMIVKMASMISSLTGKTYGFFASFVGALGTLITGSNTNSNVLFGAFQVAVAKEMGKNPYQMAAVQSIAGSLGVVLSPTIVYLAASVAGDDISESTLYRKTIGPTLILTAVLGGVNLLLFFF